MQDPPGGEPDEDADLLDPESAAKLAAAEGAHSSCQFCVLLSCQFCVLLSCQSYPTRACCAPCSCSSSIVSLCTRQFYLLLHHARVHLFRSICALY